MTLHAFGEYLRYRRRAHGRHGTHSPFVYGFVEEVLRRKVGTLEERILRYLDASTYAVLSDELRKDIRGWRVEKLDGNISLKEDSMYTASLRDALKKREAPQVDVLWVFSDYTPSHQLLERIKSPLLPGTVVLIPSPHIFRARTESWNILRAQPDVTLSIDLYEMGLLFFPRKEFRVKQHFVLR